MAHGDPSNTAVFDLPSSVALSPSKVISGLGSFADGYSPVMWGGPGNVVMANQQGRVMVFKADGTKLWERQLPNGFGVSSTPAISMNGTIYLLSSRNVRDHTVTPSVQRIESEFNGFTPDGGFLFHFPLPQHYAGGNSTAPLNVVRSPTGAEVIVFPMVYQTTSSRIVRLFAYSLGGGLIADVSVNSYTAELSSSWFGEPQGWAGQYRAPNHLPESVKRPLMGVGVTPPSTGSESTVVVNDGLKSVVRYQFDGVTFQELSRYPYEYPLDVMSSPVIGRDGVAVLTGWTHVLGINPIGGRAFEKEEAVHSGTPILLPNGRFVIVTRENTMFVTGTNRSVATGSDSIVRPAASRTHLFVSTKLALLTFRQDTLELVGSYPWSNGGRVAPIIGQGGEVFAVADNKLYLFPNADPLLPRQTVDAGVGGTSGGAGVDGGGNNNPKPMDNALNPAILTAPQATTDSGDGGNAITGGKVFQAQPNAILNGGMPAPPEQATDQPPPQEAALPTSQQFDPPLTASGKPLSACVDADFDDCGKAAARAFCESMGFTKASNIDIDTKKVQAETLSGAVCSAKKCKVVDKVTCSR